MRPLPSRPIRFVVIIPFVLSLLACGLGGGSSVVGDTSSSSPTTGTPDTTTPTASAFTLSGVTVAADPGNFSSGTCTSSVTFHFTATLTAPTDNPGGTVTYQWLTSGGSYPAQTVSFAAGDASHTVTLARSLSAALGNGHSYWVGVQITAPSVMASPHANYSFQCQFAALGAMASVSPPSVMCPGGMCPTPTPTFAFTSTITVAPSPGGTITYHWVRSDSASTPTLMLMVSPGATSVQVSGGESWTTSACGPHWEQLMITMPNQVLSNQAVFTISC